MNVVVELIVLFVSVSVSSAALRVCQQASIVPDHMSADIRSSCYELIFHQLLTFIVLILTYGEQLI